MVTAIHAGSRVRNELLPLMKISEGDRRFEEDIATDMIISLCPNIIWGLDSRSEYDLNRAPELALPLSPEMFWGVQVYNKPPTAEMKRRSMKKYNNFYNFVENYIRKILNEFGFCVVIDIHSYNVSRQIATGISMPPVFNIGTKAIDSATHRSFIDAWINALSGINIPDIETSVAENLVFTGKGEFCRRLSSLDERILVLPTEIAKVYMDEHTGKLYKDRIKNIAEQLAKIINKLGSS